MTAHDFKVGDILTVSPAPCRDNTMARDNLRYLNEHFHNKVTMNTKFIVVSTDHKDKKMIKVTLADKSWGIIESTFSSRFVLYKKRQMLDEGLFEL